MPDTKKIMNNDDEHLLDKDSNHKKSQSIPKQEVSQRTKRALYILCFAATIMVAVRWKFVNHIQEGTSTIDETLKSMLRIEARVPVKNNLKIAVGFGSCLDIYVSSKDLITERYSTPIKGRYHESIRTQDELNEVLAYFFSEGAAAERYIDNRTLFGELVDQAKASQGSRQAVGGNAAVMAKRFALEGVDRVLLGTQYSRSTRDHYNDNLVISGPEVDLDDVHICIEYPAGEKWGDLKAPRANRLIIHSDYSNPLLKSVDNFIDRLAGIQDLDLLVIGGLQMMDNIPIPIEARRERLVRLQQVLDGLSLPKVHLELASFTEELLLDNIRELIIPYVHSLGMNEQELPNLLKYLSKDGIEIRSEVYPRVATTLDQMRQLYQMLQRPTKGKLSRIHAHTLAFQAIMTRVESSWKNTLTSSVKAALTAHRYTCGSHKIDMAKTKLIMDESYTTSKQGSRRRIPFNPKHPVVCWQENLVVDDSSSPIEGSQRSKSETIEICVAPVLVCTEVKQTGGAGDNVSAAGLVLQF